jgi:mRNA interferase YafQ
LRSIGRTNQFKKDYKKWKSIGIETILNDILKLICNREKLPQKYFDHKLSGYYIGRRECHLKPDILLIYKVEEDQITLERLGSHSELFK